MVLRNNGPSQSIGFVQDPAIISIVLSPQAIERVAQALALTAGERRYLLSCPVGHGLLIAGERRIPLAVKASAAEHELVTSDPAELSGRLEGVR